MTRAVVTGATGNVASAVVEALAGDPTVDEVVGLARRQPSRTVPGVLRHRLPLVPANERLASQVVHATDAADAHRRVIHLWGGVDVIRTGAGAPTEPRDPLADAGRR